MVGGGRSMDMAVWRDEADPPADGGMIVADNIADNMRMLAGVWFRNWANALSGRAFFRQFGRSPGMVDFGVDFPPVYV